MRIVGHGIDLVEVARIAQMLERHGQAFLDRCFTPAEQDYGRDSRRRNEHLAARFAAKEALIKALGTGLRSGINWTDIEVHNEPSGRPAIRLSRSAAEVALTLGADQFWLSLSHTDAHATASVIAVDTRG